MTDFNGFFAPNLISGPFPDANAGTPKAQGASTGGGAGIPYPPAPLDQADSAASPKFFNPFERIEAFIPTFGVDKKNVKNIAVAENSSVVAGPSQLIPNASPFRAGGPATFAGALDPGLQADWFEKLLVIPGQLDLGNVLSDQVRDLYVLNNYRRENRIWTTFINNASVGVSVSGVPTLPDIVAPLEEITLQVSVSSQGPPQITGTLDFIFDSGPEQVTLTGTRVVLFPYEPQTPIRETLQFLTDLMVSSDGTEQRTSLREGPRQAIRMTIRQDSDLERDAMLALLYDWHARLFGVPIWWEARLLEADTILGDDTIQVTTEYADYRVGSLVTLGSVYNDFETFEIMSITSNTIVIEGEFAKPHVARQTLVMPVRLAYTERSIDQSRFLTGVEDTTINFTTIDNADLADASAFATYNSKVLIDRLNKASGRTAREGYQRGLQRMDSGTGQIEQRSLWTKSKPVLALGLQSQSRQETWEIRQLMHYLAGRRVSFYLGTDRNDLKLAVDASDLANSIDIEFIDFTTFYQEVTPRSDIQITRTDGSVSQHEITGSTIVTPEEVERLNVDPAISPALPVSEVERIEFLTLSRFDSDDIAVEHERAGDAMFRAPTLGVFE